MKTPDEIRQKAALLIERASAMEAWQRKEPVQFFSHGSKKWTTLAFDDGPDFDSEVRYRPAPKPVTRPWSVPDDVPPLCWLSGNDGNKHSFLVVGLNLSGVSISGRMATILWDELRFWSYSTNRKEWHPCTVTEDAK